MSETTEINRELVEMVKKVQEEVVNIRWTVNNFPEAYFETGYLKSDTFHTGSGTFLLELSYDEHRDFLFCLAQDLSESFEQNFECKTWLEDLDGNKYCESGETYGDDDALGYAVYCFENFLRKRDLGTTVKLKNDVAIFCCEVRQRMPGEEIILPEVDLQLLQKLWDSCKRGLFDGINIQVESKTLMVSKNILAIHSDVFERMFLTSHCKEVQENTIEVKDTRYEIMEAFVEYLNGSQIDNLSEVCEDLFVLSHRYMVAQLQEVCAKEMIESLNKENLFSRLQLAFMYDQQDLKNAVLNYVTSKDCDLNFRQIMKSSEWTELEVANKALTNEIMDAFFDKMKLFPEKDEDQVPSKRQKLG